MTDQNNIAPPAAPQPTAVLPSVDQLIHQVRTLGPTEDQNGAPPAASPIDVSNFVREQAVFIQAQTSFLMNRNSAEYSVVVTAYSQAQNEFIRAQGEMLRSLGIA